MTPHGGGGAGRGSFHKFQIKLLKSPLNGGQAAPQHGDFSSGKKDGHFLRRGVRAGFQRRIGRRYGPQELRVGQQVTPSVIGQHLEAGDFGVRAETWIAPGVRDGFAGLVGFCVHGFDAVEGAVFARLAGGIALETGDLVP